MKNIFPIDWNVSIPIIDSDQTFPARRVYCVGRNYADHAREMGSDPTREPPFFFMKPADAVVPVPLYETIDLPYPQETQNFHHEAEVVIAIGPPDGLSIAETFDTPYAMDVWGMIFGFTVGIDFTRRDLQAVMKKEGKPWEIAKAFDRSAPVAPITPVANVDASDLALWLRVNDEVRQEGRTSQMIWSIPEIVAHLSRYFELRPGDLIFTGTPSGVSAVEKGDVIECGAEGLGALSVRIV